MHASCFYQGYYEMRERILHRSTSQGSIGSPIYSRHNYTPTLSRSPQHFHRPGELWALSDVPERLILKFNQINFSFPSMDYLQLSNVALCSHSSKLSFKIEKAGPNLFCKELGVIASIFIWIFIFVIINCELNVYL